MTTTVVVLLGVMALASLTQAVFLIVLAVEGRRLAQRVDTFQSRIGGELRPILGEVTRATENLAAASAATLGQARRIDVMMTDVTRPPVRHAGALPQPRSSRPRRGWCR